MLYGLPCLRNYFCMKLNYTAPLFSLWLHFILLMLNVSFLDFFNGITTKRSSDYNSLNKIKIKVHNVIMYLFKFKLSSIHVCHPHIIFLIEIEIFKDSFINL